MTWLLCHFSLIGSVKAYLETCLQHRSSQAQENVMATETTEVAEPLVNPWHPNAIPPIDPRNPCIVNPSGEFGPESYLDTGAYFPAKYPDFKESSKQNKKKQDENGKKKKPSLKLDFSKIKKGMIQTTLDQWLLRPKTPTWVWFKEWVFLKEITTHTYRTLEGILWSEYYCCPTSYWGTKCYVTCPADEVKKYLKCMENKTHPCYKKIDTARFHCEWDFSLVLATSHSVNNPHWTKKWIYQGNKTKAKV